MATCSEEEDIGANNNLDFLDLVNVAADASVIQCIEDKSSKKEKIQVITIEQIEELERDIDIFEKVSLVFLLYPDIDLALQRLQAVEAHIKSASQSSSLNEICLLSDWARTSARTKGKCSIDSSGSLSCDSARALVEALCIVQDFESLMRLGSGDRKTGLATREMSLKTPEKFCVNYARNVLYRLCEDLHPPVAEELARKVEMKRPDLVRRFPPDARLFEVVLLHWASRGYISISDGMNVDVRNLSNTLLIMGEMGIAKMLDTHFPYKSKSTNIEESKMNVFSEIVEMKQYSSETQKTAASVGEEAGASLPLVTDDQAPNIEMIQITEESKIVPAKEMIKITQKTEVIPAKMELKKKVDTNERKGIYSLNKNKMGFCIIVNQKNFYTERNPALAEYLPEKPLEDRLGTDVDRDRLTEAFTSLGLDIKIKSNLRHDQILALARSIAMRTDLADHSCFVFCVLSHGQKDVVYGSNSIPVEIMELVETFCGSKCPALIGKPKIFIIQACQGSKLQKTPLSYIATDGPSKSLPGVKDYVKFLSTVPGYVSLRHKVTGSWFIDNLCEEIICRDPNSSLLDVFTQVNAAVDKKSSVVNNSVISMMSELRSTLRGPVYLPVDPDAMKKATLLAMQRALFDKLFEEFFQRLETSGETRSRTKWYY